MAKVKCDCGCGALVYHNQLTEVKVEQAIDDTLRETVTKKRFWVTRQCKEPFEEELKLMTLLQILVRFWAPKPRRRWYLVRFWLNPLAPWRDLVVWWKRLGAAVRVMRMQHAIYVRTKGFDYARTRAKQSAIMFAAPRPLQGFLARAFKGRLEKVENASKARAASEAQAAAGDSEGGPRPTAESAPDAMARRTDGSLA